MRPSPGNPIVWLLVCLALLATGCGPSQPGAVRLATSTIPAPAVRGWLEEISKLPKPFHASLSVTGSTTAIEQLVEGKLDLAVTSRRMTVNEFLAGQSRGRKIEETLIGFGIYQVLVNPQNPVASLTLEQVGQIFSRQIKDWSEVGGPKMPIVCVYRRLMTGDYDLFFEKEVAIKLEPNGNQDAGITVANDTAAIAAAVQGNPGAIGYLLTTDPAPGLKALAIKGRQSDVPLSPSVESALSGKYPMLRPLYLYIDKSAHRDVEYFRMFAEGEKGRSVLAASGFSPVPRARKGRNEPDHPVVMPDW